MLNEIYLQQKTQQQIGAIYNKESQVVLFDLFKPETFKTIQLLLQKHKFTHSKNPLTHSFKEAKLSKEFLAYLNDPTLQLLLKQAINTKKKLTLEWQLLQFSPQDYTLLSDVEKQPAKHHLLISLTESWNPAWGGSSYYVDGSGEFTQIPSNGNILSVVKMNKNTRHFVKYINSLAAKKKRTILIGMIS